MTRFVQRLSAPATGWTATADVIVVGSGIAGLTAALELRRLVGKVLIVTKGPLSSGNTVWAQGGIAAALDPEDTAEEHLQDTLVAGAGLCSEQAVRALVTEGPERVRKLVDRGAHFDTQADGSITLTREGGHHRDRIAHAGGDATGAEISRALVARLEAVRSDPRIEVIENAMVVDLLDRGARRRRAPWPRVRRDPPRHRRGHARRRRRRARQGRRGGDGRHRPGVLVVDQPGLGHRRRRRRWVCARAP